MLAILGPDAPLHENMSPAKIRSLMTESGADILVAGGRNQYLAIKEGFPFIDANQERHTAYAGYEGLVNLARRMSEAIEFYRIGREGVATAGPARDDGPRPVARAINPLRHSPAIGAAMALQGVDRAAVVHHGAQGCSFLGKVLLTKHFREPIALVVDEDLLGGPRARRSGAARGRRARRRSKSRTPTWSRRSPPASPRSRGTTRRPRCAASTPGSAAARRRSATPDYAGGLEEGFAAAVTALVALATPGTRDERRVNILAGPGLTPADCRELHAIAAAFGLVATILPDLSALEGGRSGYSGLTAGGTPLAAIRAMGSAGLTIALGASLAGAAASLERTCGVPYRVLPYPIGLAAADAFFELLAATGGLAVPERFARERRILVDGMRDAMTAFGGRRAAVALETDAAVAISGLLAEMNATVTQAVVPTASRRAEHHQRAAGRCRRLRLARSAASTCSSPAPTASCRPATCAPPTSSGGSRSSSGSATATASTSATGGRSASSTTSATHSSEVPHESGVRDHGRLPGRRALRPGRPLCDPGFHDGGLHRLPDLVFAEGRDAAVESTRGQGDVHDNAVEQKVERLARLPAGLHDRDRRPLRGQDGPAGDHAGQGPRADRHRSRRPSVSWNRSARRRRPGCASP